MNQRIQENLKLEQQFIELQKEHYELLLKKEEDTKRFRHDISNHLICIREFAKVDYYLPQIKKARVTITGTLTDQIDIRRIDFCTIISIPASMGYVKSKEGGR